MEASKFRSTVIPRRIEAAPAKIEGASGTIEAAPGKREGAPRNIEAAKMEIEGAPGEIEASIRDSRRMVRGGFGSTK